MLRASAFLIGFALGAGIAPARADQAADIARIHVEAIGGMTRIQALRTLRISGNVITAKEQLPFTLIAARPNRVRTETQLGGRVIVQASDGVAPPWTLDPANSPARTERMAPAEAELFLFDADFDDPLVGWEERGYRLEYAGEADMGGRKLVRLLVVRSLTENIFVLLDPRTYLLAFRLQQLSADGSRREVVSRYGDHRPVAGVLLPHEVTVFINGRLSQQATFERIEANPVLPRDIFQPPTGP